MRRALTVIVAALAMSALLLGAALTLASLGDSSVSIVEARARLKTLRNVSVAFQLSLRSASLAFLDSYAEALAAPAPSDQYSLQISQGLETAMASISFSSVCTVAIRSESAHVGMDSDGSLLADINVSYSVSDAGGDSLDVSYSAALHHGMKLLGLSSLVSSRHAEILKLLSSLGNASLRDLSALNGTYVNVASGVSVRTVLLAQQPGSVELSTLAWDSGQGEVLGGRYSYVMELESVVPLPWSQ